MIRALRPSALAGAARRFCFAPSSARPLAMLRIGVALVALVHAATIAGHLAEIFGNRGLVQWTIADLAVPPGMPRISTLARLVRPLGIPSAACVTVVFYGYVGSLLALLVGIRTRLAAIASWLCHLALLASSCLSAYGVEAFLAISLFYCVAMPVGKTLSIDAWRARSRDEPTSIATISLRVLQLHMCTVYLTSGIAKARGIQWWNGEAIWRAMSEPQFRHFDVSWMPHAPWVPAVLTWSVLVVELGYAVFVWPRATRRAWVLATIGLHVGIGVFLGLWSFAAMMIVLTGAAFGDGILFGRGASSRAASSGGTRAAPLVPSAS